jgi:transposase
MARADGAGLPLFAYVTSASPHEVTLIEITLGAPFVHAQPARLIGDLAYDSDPLRFQLKEQGIKLSAPHNAQRSKPKTQDGRELHSNKRRWRMERCFARLTRSRKLPMRIEFHFEKYLGFVHLACIMVLMKIYLGP